MANYDAIVVGVGGMGSAVLYELARRRLRVLGLEQHQIGHDRGSSHGQFRIIRKAYFEHPDYVPLVTEAYKGWKAIEERTGHSLWQRTGLVMFGEPDHPVIRKTQAAIEAYHLDIEEIGAREVPERFAQFRIHPAAIALYEPDAGFLRVERCVRSYVDAAVSLGAEIRTGICVRSWRETGAGVLVECDGDSLTCRKLAICPGPWAANLLGNLGSRFTIRRKVQLWYKTDVPYHVASSGFPVFAQVVGDRFFYGFPAEDGLIKAGEHSGNQVVETADQLDRRLHDEDHRDMDAFMTRTFSGIRTPPVRHSVCMYTMTPDEHFVMGLHPRHANVAVAAGFSGHGFKFAPVVGTAIADYLESGMTPLPVEFLSPSRLPT